MKPKILINILAMAIFALTLNGCKKDHPADNGQAQIMQNIHTKTLIEKFNYFRNKMQSNLKTGEFITLDSAIWYTEATLSYDHAYPDSTSEDFHTQSTFYTLSVDNNNMVSMEDVQTVYGLMQDSLSYHLSLIDEEVKFIAFADVQLNDVENNVASLEMISGYGTGLVLGFYDPFEEDDDWLWGTIGSFPLAGKCDGTQIDISDGSNELQFRFNHPNYVPVTYSYYTEFETFEICFEEKDNEWVTYVDENGIDDNCLENEELTYFLNEGHILIYNSPDDPDYGYKPEGKDFIRIEVLDYQWELNDNDIYTHFYKITYAKPGGSPSPN